VFALSFEKMSKTFASTSFFIKIFHLFAIFLSFKNLVGFLKKYVELINKNIFCSFSRTKIKTDKTQHFAI